MYYSNTTGKLIETKALGLIISFFLSTTVLFSQASHPCKDRWWQREIPQPSNNQIINPKYLEKKRELEITCDDYNNLLKSIRYFISLGQKPTSLVEAAAWEEKKIKKLEYELSKIDIYITNLYDNKLNIYQRNPQDVNPQIDEIRRALDEIEADRKRRNPPR